MARWQPDARGRLARAALELFEERGFEQTTALQIAERAGVTERTFFRHFVDKREVLFDGSHQLEHLLAADIEQAPATTAPIEAVGDAMARVAAELDGRREFARRRAAVLAANPRLQERELFKLASMRTTAAAALRERAVDEPAASMVAEVAVAAFRVGFEQWIAEGQRRSVGEHVREALDELSSQLPGRARG